MEPNIDRETEKAAVAKAINDHITWCFPDKKAERAYASVVNDSTLFFFQPDSKSTIVGFDEFRNVVENVFMNPACNPTRTEIRDLRINLSQLGDAAWFSCILDDFGEWGGKPWAWVNTRWTGVLEKREGKWLVAQMHFSFAQDAPTSSSSQYSSSTQNK